VGLDDDGARQEPLRRRRDRDRVHDVRPTLGDASATVADQERGRRVRMGGRAGDEGVLADQTMRQSQVD